MESPKPIEQSSSLNKSQPLRLWISSKWYIPVDVNGRCTGPCLEGALGFVVQLQSSEGENLARALKLPRLLGETHRENAYISDLMEKELEAVQEVFDKQEGHRKGLLRADIWELGGPLRGQIETGKGVEEARKWEGAIVLVRFEKGHKPRFCLVRKVIDGGAKNGKYEADTDGDNASEIETFPKIDDCPIKSIRDYERLQETALQKDRYWQNTVFIDLGKESEQAPLIFNKGQALKQAATGQTWFTCVPSIPYEWARGTLQEAISLHKRGNKWGTAEHFSLAGRICRGIHALHSKGMIHADLRPANLVYTGEPNTPDSYYLCDYGSFAKMSARDPEHDPMGNTVLGPVAGTERASPFYAPERRAGLEREAADTAVIRHSGSAPTLEIILGWRSELEKLKKSEFKSLFESDDDNWKKSVTRPNPGKMISASTLRAGDRIQIRDYIFDIIRATEDGGKQMLECRSQHWKIHHGRIVVESTDEFSEDQLLPIPRTIELQQWSAATDVYGIGALFLYSVYRSQNVKTSEPSGVIEEKFREMLSHLESESYFNTIWGEVEWLREQLEYNLDKNRDASAIQFGELPFRQIKEENQNPANLRQETIEVVRRITQTVPWSKRLVEVFDFKLGTFIFFIHFVLCCLHRQSHLRETETALGDVDSKRERPFCEDRREPPRENGGASRALVRLKVIRGRIEDRRLDSLKVGKNEIPDYDSRPDAIIRIAQQALEKAATTVVQQGRIIIDSTRELSVSPVNWAHVPKDLLTDNTAGHLNSVAGLENQPKSRKKTIFCIPTIANLKEPLDELQKAIELSSSNTVASSTDSSDGITPSLSK